MVAVGSLTFSMDILLKLVIRFSARISFFPIEHIFLIVLLYNLAGNSILKLSSTSQYMVVAILKHLWSSRPPVQKSIFVSTTGIKIIQMQHTIALKNILSDFLWIFGYFSESLLSENSKLICSRSLTGSGTFEIFSIINNKFLN